MPVKKNHLLKQNKVLRIFKTIQINLNLRSTRNHPGRYNVFNARSCVADCGIRNCKGLANLKADAVLAKALPSIYGRAADGG